VTRTGPAPEDRYAELVKTMTSRSGVTRISEGKGFGSSGQLRIDGKIFAMLVRDELVVKLPRRRVDELVSGRHGRPFDAGKGKPLREWFVLSPSSDKRWLALAEEALEFVRGG
jgi:hypothetical protein